MRAWWLSLAVAGLLVLASRAQVVTFEFPFAVVGSTKIAITTFTEAPPLDVWNNLGNFTQLRAITLFNVRSSVMALEASIGSLTNLQVLILPYALRGPLPSQIGLLTNLVFLDLRFGKLSGVPSQFGQLTQLTSMYLGSNPLECELPSELGLMSALGFLVGNVGGLTGSLPSQLGLLTGLHDFLMENNNKLRGTLPAQLFRAPGWQSLTDLDLSETSVGGTIPSQIGRWSHVTFFRTEATSLTGTLPSELGHLTLLQLFAISSSRFHGSLPSQLGRLALLHTLLVGNNAFTGPIPSQLALQSLAILQLHKNKLVGTVPAQFALCTNLFMILLSGNQLSGTIPHGVFVLPSLDLVSVGGNQFEGTIPRDAGDIWREDCDESGLDDARCRHHCPNCDAGAVRIVECDRTGKGSRCVALWAVFLGILVCAAACTALAKSVHRRSASFRQLLWTSAVTTFSVLDVTVDFLFAWNASGAVSVLAFVSWGCVLGLSLALAIRVCHLQQLTSRPSHMLCVCLVAVPNPGALRTLMQSNPSRLNVLALRHSSWLTTHAVLLLTILETGVQGSLQLTSIVMGDTSIVTLVSFGFSASTVMAMLTVSLVLFLARDTQLKLAQQAPDDEDEQDADEGSQASDNVQHQRQGEGGQANRQETGADPEGCKKTTGRRQRLAMLFASLVPAALVYHQAAPNGRDAPDTAVAWVHPRAATLSNLSTGLVTRRFEARGASTKPKFDAPCSGTLVLVELPFICAAGQLVGFLSHDLEVTVVTLPDLVAEDPPLFFLSLPSLSCCAHTRTRTRTTLDSWGFFWGGSSVATHEAAFVSSELGLLSGLRILFLERQLTSLPSQIGILGELNLLRFSISSIGSTMPSELGLCTGLLDAELRAANLEGTLPSQLARLVSLRFLNVADNSLVGTVPTEFGRLEGLHLLAVDFNFPLGGTLPSQLGNLARLNSLFIDFTEIGGALPSQLGKLAHLTTLQACNTGIAGTIPEEILGLPLSNFWICSGLVTGTLPTTLGRMTSLENLRLANTRLAGSIPTELSRLTSLTRLALSGNRFDGAIPSTLGLLTLLRYLDLSDQGLEGAVPSQLGRLSQLTALYLKGNALSGTLPTELALLPLEYVEIEHNNFKGSFPAGFSDAWRFMCDYSGVHDSAHCFRRCGACPFGSVQLRSCNAWGEDQLCTPGYALVIVGVVLVVLEAVVMKKLGPPGLQAREAAQNVLVLLVLALHLLDDLLFLTATPGVFGAVAAVVFVASMLSRLVLIASELLRMQRLDSRMDLTTSASVFVVAVVVCLVDPHTLVCITRGRHTRRSTLRPSLSAGLPARPVGHRVVVALLLGDVPMLALQLVRVVGTAGSSVVVFAIIATVLSLATNLQHLSRRAHDVRPRVAVELRTMK